MSLKLIFKTLNNQIGNPILCLFSCCFLRISSTLDRWNHGIHQARPAVISSYLCSGHYSSWLAISSACPTEHPNQNQALGVMLSLQYSHDMDPIFLGFLLIEGKNSYFPQFNEHPPMSRTKSPLQLEIKES